MLTASELGMLCAKGRVKSAAGWPTPLIGGGLSAAPPSNAPRVPSPKPKPWTPWTPSLPGPPHPDKGYTSGGNGFSSSIYDTGITSGNYFFPYPGGKRPMRDHEYPSAGKEPDFLQPPKQPKFNYLNPPGDNIRTKISPRNFVEPIYAKYPGGLDQAIQDSQRWQDEARLAGLTTWTPEGLSKEVPVYTGKYVSERETPSTPHSPSDFAGVNANVGGYFSPRGGYVAMNFPAYENYPSRKASYASSVGHELTHATHYAGPANTNPSRNSNVFPPNFMGEKRQKYIGDPTEFAARISEARRDWLQHNPGKRISTVQEGSNVLNDIAADTDAASNAKPTKFIIPRSKYPTMTPKDKHSGLSYNFNVLADWQEKIPKGAPAGLPSRAALFARNAPVPPYVPHHKEQIADIYKQIGRNVLHEDEIAIPPRKLPYDLGFPLEKIMSNPELKQRTILQILSSVVQNKQRQAPGTNV